MAVYRFYEYAVSPGYAANKQMEDFLLEVADIWNTLSPSCEAKVLFSAELGTDKKFLVSKHASQVEAQQFWEDYAKTPERKKVTEKWAAQVEETGTPVMKYLKLFSFNEIAKK